MGGEAMMDKFVQRLNVEHYTRLLETVTDEKERERIRKLLAEEIQKKPQGGGTNSASRRAG
jgi:hypothetical protein